MLKLNNLKSKSKNLPNNLELIIKEKLLKRPKAGKIKPKIKTTIVAGKKKTDNKKKIEEHLKNNKIKDSKKKVNKKL